MGRDTQAQERYYREMQQRQLEAQAQDKGVTPLELKISETKDFGKDVSGLFQEQQRQLAAQRETAVQNLRDQRSNSWSEAESAAKAQFESELAAFRQQAIADYKAQLQSNITGLQNDTAYQQFLADLDNQSSAARQEFLADLTVKKQQSQQDFEADLSAKRQEAITGFESDIFSQTWKQRQAFGSRLSGMEKQSKSNFASMLGLSEETQKKGFEELLGLELQKSSREWAAKGRYPEKSAILKSQEQNRLDFMTGLGKWRAEETAKFEKELAVRREEETDKFGLGMTAWETTERIKFEGGLMQWEKEQRGIFDLAQTDWEQEGEGSQNQAIADWKAKQMATHDLWKQQTLAELNQSMFALEGGDLASFMGQPEKSEVDVSTIQFIESLQSWEKGERSKLSDYLVAEKTTQQQKFESEVLTPYAASWQQESLSAQLAKVEIPSLSLEGLFTSLGLLPKVPKVTSEGIQIGNYILSSEGKVKSVHAHPLAFFGGLVAPFEAAAYTALDVGAYVLGKPQVSHPRYPPTLLSAFITSGIQSALGWKLAASPQLTELHELPPHYAAGTLFGDIFLGYATGKVIGKVAGEAKGLVWEKSLFGHQPLKYSHTAYSLKNAILGIKGKLPSVSMPTGIDEWLFEHSGWYRARTGGLADQIVSYPSTGIISKSNKILETELVGRAWFDKEAGGIIPRMWDVGAAQKTAWSFAASPKSGLLTITEEPIRVAAKEPVKDLLFRGAISLGFTKSASHPSSSFGFSKRREPVSELLSPLAVPESPAEQSMLRQVLGKTTQQAATATSYTGSGVSQMLMGVQQPAKIAVTKAAPAMIKEVSPILGDVFKSSSVSLSSVAGMGIGAEVSLLTEVLGKPSQTVGEPILLKKAKPSVALRKPSLMEKEMFIPQAPSRLKHKQRNLWVSSLLSGVATSNILEPIEDVIQTPVSMQVPVLSQKSIQVQKTVQQQVSAMSSTARYILGQKLQREKGGQRKTIKKELGIMKRWKRAEALYPVASPSQAANYILGVKNGKSQKHKKHR